MPSSNFTFLKSEWPELYKAAREAESQVRSAPRSCLFSCRYALEQATKWLYTHDEYLKIPYNDNLGALIHDPSFKDNMPPKLFQKLNIIHKNGNLAAHSSKKLAPIDAFQCTKELFHFLYWLYRSYSKAEPQDIEFNSSLLVAEPDAKPDLTQAAILKLQKQLDEQNRKLKEERKAHAVSKDELAKQTVMNKQVAENKERNAYIPDTHDYTEAETRSYIIDLLLKESGWDIEAENVREFTVEGMPNPSGKGKVDYVLWGDDGKPLAIVEAKRTTLSAKKGQHQAKLYADCLEERYGVRPIIFFTNGYETHIWDDTKYPPRPVQGFHKKDELERLFIRRTQAKKLSDIPLNRDVAGRPYQELGIRSVTEHYSDNQRKALVVMATGTGKTRFAIALADILQRAGWAKRILFLADRNALVKQAKNAFLEHMPDSNPLDIRTDRASGDTARIVLSTYPTMIGVIDELVDGERRFGVGHFDLIIIDEAHRSVYQKYRSIFEYFDSFLLGLTATPRDEVDHNTYELFELEDGVPTYHYELDEAVNSGWLVPPTNLSVPLKFQREGIKYDNLSDAEKNEFEAALWNEEEDGIREVEKSKINTWLFNADTVDKVLKFLFENGLKVDGGDKLGKTIIFAASFKHAEFIQERFDKNFPRYAGHFAQVIASGVDYAEDALEKFSLKDSDPQIAISIDMLDTGVDVPEILNLVFFKRIFSRVKFHQMIGRGTRPCEDLFAPGEDKKEFIIFDFCENFEFFGNNPQGFVNSAGHPLHQRIFLKRLGLLLSLNKQPVKSDEENHFLDAVKDTLYRTVHNLNVDSFLVRPSQKYVEQYADIARWDSISQEDEIDIINNLSGLQSEYDEGDALCKGFDLLILNTQTELLAGTSTFEGYKGSIIGIAAALIGKSTIPAVQKEMDLLESMQNDAFWESPCCGLLERIRISLRELIRFLDKKVQEPVYTNFKDTIGEATTIDMPDSPSSLAQYKLKVQQFIRSHQNHITINKIRMNKPITALDISELERMLFEAEEVGSKEKFTHAFGEGPSLGSLIRDLVGLDRVAAQKAFSTFLEAGQYNSTQIHFVDQIIDHLTSKGTMDPSLLFKSSPFIDSHPSGVRGVFSIEESKKVVECLKAVNQNAVA